MTEMAKDSETKWKSKDKYKNSVATFECGKEIK
jgi:hypothetical protein